MKSFVVSVAIVAIVTGAVTAAVVGPDALGVLALASFAFSSIAALVGTVHGNNPEQKALHDQTRRKT